MEIVEYCFGEEKFLTQIERCEWRAAKYLAHLLKEDKLQTALGGWGKLYLLTEGDTLVSLSPFPNAIAFPFPNARKRRGWDFFTPHPNIAESGWEKC